MRMHGFSLKILKNNCRSLVQSSPFLNAVGSDVDMEGVVLRGEKEFD